MRAKRSIHASAAMDVVAMTESLATISASSWDDASGARAASRGAAPSPARQPAAAAIRCRDRHWDGRTHTSRARRSCAAPRPATPISTDSTAAAPKNRILVILLLLIIDPPTWAVGEQDWRSRPRHSRRDGASIRFGEYTAAWRWGDDRPKHKISKTTPCKVAIRTRFYVTMLRRLKQRRHLRPLSAVRETPRRRRSAAGRRGPSCLPARLPCRAH